MTSESPEVHKSVMLNTPEQLEAWEDAVGMVDRMDEDPDSPVRVERWAGEPKDGEVVRVLADAFRGRL